MSLPQFFLDTQVLADCTAQAFPLDLSRDDAKHARVLRLKAGERIAVVDASQDYFVVEIVSFDDAVPVVRIAQRGDSGATGPFVTLYQGLAKGDKMESVIRHATEVGVRQFVPLACRRSVMKVNPGKTASKLSRWRSIAKSAAMQSGQRVVPEVEEPQTIAQAASSMGLLDALLVFWEEAPSNACITQALSHLDSPRGASIGVVVGPEGGLERAEVDALLASCPHAFLVSLGQSILRTETAGVIAPALVLYECGQLGGRSQDKVRP